MKRGITLALLAALALGIAIPFAVTSASQSSETIPLKEAKLIIEHNATDEDTGFQGFIDSEGWRDLTVRGPGGQVLSFSARQELGKHGLTEIFFETVEPANAEVPIEDVLDLHAYLMSLPAVHSPARAPEVPMLGVARRGVGLWKRMALDDRRFEPDPAQDESWNRGDYLTNGPGHCGECHTPRNWMMIPDESRHMAGGPHPAEEGDVPSLRGLLARERYQFQFEP